MRQTGRNKRNGVRQGERERKKERERERLTERERERERTNLCIPILTMSVFLVDI